MSYKNKNIKLLKIYKLVLIQLANINNKKDGRK